jgi:hypothetical protein
MGALPEECDQRQPISTAGQEAEWEMITSREVGVANSVEIGIGPF